MTNNTDTDNTDNYNSIYDHSEDGEEYGECKHCSKDLRYSDDESYCSDDCFEQANTEVN